MESTRGRDILGDLAKILADRGVDLLAVQADVADGQGTVRVVTDDNLRASDALRARLQTRGEEVILLTIPHKPGMLHRVGEILAEAALDTQRIYATTIRSVGDCCVVLHTANDDLALSEARGARIGT